MQEIDGLFAGDYSLISRAGGVEKLVNFTDHLVKMTQSGIS